MTRYSLLLVFLLHGQITAIDSRQGKFLPLAQIEPSKLKVFKEAFAKTMAPGENIENVRYFCLYDDGTLQGIKYKHTNLLGTTTYFTNDFKDVRDVVIKEAKIIQYYMYCICILVSAIPPRVNMSSISAKSIMFGLATACFSTGRSFGRTLSSTKKANERQFLEQRNSECVIDDFDDGDRLFTTHLNPADKIKSAGKGLVSGLLNFLSLKLALYFEI